MLSLRNYRAEFSWIMELSLIDGRRLKEDIGGEKERERGVEVLLQTTLEQWKLTTNDCKDSSTKKLWRRGKEAKDVRFEHGFHFVRSWLTERWNLILSCIRAMSREGNQLNLSFWFFNGFFKLQSVENLEEGIIAKGGLLLTFGTT